MITVSLIASFLEFIFLGYQLIFCTFKLYTGYKIITDDSVIMTDAIYRRMVKHPWLLHKDLSKLLLQLLQQLNFNCCIFVNFIEEFLEL